MKSDKQHLIDHIDSSTDEYERMLYMLALYEPDEEVATWIKRAYDDKEWDWKKCDGCTGVDECHSPKGMKFPPCVMHDYLRWLVKKGRMTIGKCDWLFLKAQRQFRVWAPKAWWRYLTVRWPAWYLWKKWTK